MRAVLIGVAVATLMIGVVSRRRSSSHRHERTRHRSRPIRTQRSHHSSGPVNGPSGILTLALLAHSVELAKHLSFAGGKSYGNATEAIRIWFNKARARSAERMANTATPATNFWSALLR